MTTEFAIAGGVHGVRGLLGVQVGRLPARVGRRARRTRCADARVGRRERHAVLAAGQLVELGLGRRRLLQDPARLGRVRHRGRSRRRPPEALDVYTLESRLCIGHAFRASASSAPRHVFREHSSV